MTRASSLGYPYFATFLAHWVGVGGWWYAFHFAELLRLRQPDQYAEDLRDALGAYCAGGEL